MEYPHWLIVAGAVLLAIGLNIRKHRIVGPQFAALDFEWPTAKS